MSTQETPPIKAQDSQRSITLINFLLVSGMLSCLAFISNQFIRILYTEWRVSGLPFLTFLITFESLLTLYLRTRVIRSKPNPFLAVGAEWVLILLVSKLFLLLQPNAGNLWQTVLSWQGNFLESFFDVQYGLLIFFIFIIWALTRFFSPPLYQLEEDQELMEQEKLGVTFNDRQEARRNLMGLVFSLGFVMLAMTVVLKGDVQFIPFIKTPTRTFLIVLMIYFALAFVFMALNQYAILKARWYFNDIQVNADLSKRWLLFTVVFIAIVILLTVFLPTEFSFGLRPVIQTIFNVIVYIFGIVQFLFLFPISFIISIFNTLLGTQEGEQTIQPALPEFTPESSQATGPLPWWDLVRSILFWVVLIVLIVLAIRYTIRNHQGLKTFFDQIRIKVWWSDFWKWVIRGFKKISEATAETVQKGFRQVKRFFAEREVKLPKLADLIKRLPPRQAMILTYLEWVRWNKKNGLPRQSSQTPLEYAERLNNKWPGLKSDLTAFTADFITARYSRQEFDATQLNEAQDLLSAMKDFILSEQIQMENETF
jgi:hypothetical protein